MSIDLYESALKKAKENDRANRDANRTTRLSGGSASSGTVDLYESALKQAKERDRQPKRLVSTAQQRREEGGGTPAIFNAAGASRPGSVTQQITSALERMNDRGLIDTVTSSDSWDTTGEAETALKAWESQLGTLSSQVSQQERQLESAQRQLEQERESLDLNDADAVARFNQRVDEVNAQYGEYERAFNQFDTVRNRYESGIGTYHDMLIAEGGRAQNYRDEAERLAGETEQLAAELDRYRSGDVYYDAGGSGINTAQRREQLERQIEENESEIKRLRAEAEQAQWAYYSGLALNEDYAERSAPLGSQREAQIAAGESPYEAGGAIYDYINNIGNARAIRGYDAAGNEMQALGTMTEEEIGLYNYIYATQGREAAAEYLNRLRETINARLGQQRYENMSGIGRALYWIPAGINQFTSGIRQLFSEEAVPTSPTQYTSQAILEGLEGRPVASTLYELGTTLSNMAPSILASALGGWALGAAGVAGSTAGRIANLAGSALLGASAGGNAYTQKINEGYLPDEARDYSTLVGLSEGALQYVLGGIEGLGGEAVRGVAAKVGALDNVLGRIARSKAGKLVMNMISEGTEEGLQELLEPAFATLVLGEEYDANFEDAAYAFLLGALSAGVVDTVTDAGRAAAGKRRGVNFTFADMDGFIGENGVNYFEGCNTYAEVEARYRELARENHPDLGGDTATMAEINRQHSMARAYFQGRGETVPAAERSTGTETAAAEERAAGPDGVVRALSAPAAAVDTQTPANTQEGVQRATGRVTANGGIILPTADEPGGLVLPTAEDFERAGSPENLTGGIINGRTEQTDAVSGRDGGRLGGGRPGGQAGQLVEGTEGRPAAFEQSRTALERQNRAGHLRLEEVSTRELGVPEGSDTPTVRVLPEEEWDDELQRAAEDVYWRTGKEVEYVLGALEVYGSDGSTRRVRGVWREDGAIIIQADNMRVSAQQIAEHETYHEIAAQNPGTDYAVEERIREQFGEEEFARVVENYIQKLHGIVDLPADAGEAEFEAALARVKQEIYADAYAGINAFGAHAERFRDVARETVEERTRGEYRGDNEEATRSTTGPPENERYSYGGRGAANADLEALSTAEEMERRDVDAETIRQETGWFRGRDGKWRFEIDDSGMEYRYRGDAAYGNADYQRYADLRERLEADMLGLGGEPLTEAETAEFNELRERFGDMYTRPGERGDGSAPSNLLSQYIRHDELFEQYPWLENVGLRFAKLNAHESSTNGDFFGGYYNPQNNEIVLDESLRSAAQDTLIHEIQHAIQREEGFASGTNPEYWRDRAWFNDSRLYAAKRLREELYYRIGLDDFIYNLHGQISPKELRQQVHNFISNSEYGQEIKKQDEIIARLEADKEIFDSPDIDTSPMTLYRNTAGEIEARDAAARRRLTAEERRATPPDLGDENTVFADDEIPVKARFSVDEPVERTADLIAVHNIYPDDLARTLELGAFPMPSIAVIRDSLGHDDFGNISIVFGADTIDPEQDSRNRVYSRDAWTPTFPRTDTSGMSVDEIVELMETQPERQIFGDNPGRRLMMASIESFGSLDEIRAAEGRIDGTSRNSQTDVNHLGAELVKTAESLVTPENVKNTNIYAVDDAEIADFNRLYDLTEELAAAKDSKVKERRGDEEEEELSFIWADAVDDVRDTYAVEAEALVGNLTLTPRFMRTVDNLLTQEEADFLEITEEEARHIIDVVNDVGRRVTMNAAARDAAELSLDTWAQDVILAAAEGPHNLQAVKDTLESYGFTPDDESANRVLALINEAASLSTRYFEAKPHRVVEFNEIRGVVMPDDVGGDLGERLSALDIPVIEYRAGDEADRARAVNSVEGARFSVDEDVPISQAISSAGTSLRQVPALFKNPNVRFGEVNIDIGGGRFDLATEYLAERGTRNLVFDPYNRGEETNRATLDYLMAGNRADTATNANVLNVIAEAPARANVILEMAKAIKPDGRAYFMVYEGDGSGVGRETSAGYQNNRKTADYVPEIEQFFDRVERRGKLITATQPKANLPRASWEVQPGNAVRYSADEEEPRPVIAKRDLKRNLLELFSVPSGSRAELGRYIEGFADRMIRSKEYTEEDRREIFDRLYDEGVMTVAADPYLANAREWLVNRRMYVNDSIKHEFGGAEDWNEFRKRAFAAGIYFTNNPQDMAPDMWQAELGEVLPGLFDSSNLDMKQFMERVVQIAEESRDERVSLAEYTQMLADENYVSEDEVLDDLEQRVDWELRTFAEKAELETKLRGRGPEGLTNSERQRVIQEERAKYWQLHRQYQEETRQRIREEKDKRHASEREARQRIDNIIREEREKYWQRRREYQQRADRRVREERERRWAAQADARRRIDENQQEARRTYYEQLERYRAARKATDARERERRKQMAERRRETRELRDLQQRTLKQIQWLARNQYRAPEELRQQWDEVLGDLDIFAVSAANEMNYSKKYGATWRDLAEMYKDARKHNPNFMPSQELERIVARLDNDKIGELDIGALQDLYKAAVGLRTEFYNRNNVINDEMGRLFSEVYKESKAEIDSAPGGYTGKPADRVFNLEQLTPMNVLERMAGWNPNSTWYSMARQLEKGERDERAYIVQANRQLEEFLRDNEEWVMKSDGQGKDAVWYEIEVPELLELGMGDKPIFGDTVKVYMTPSMKVQMYLESKNYDNLRHMVGGRTFADKTLYSEGKRREAYAQGKTIRLAPETVRHLVENLTPEEEQLASLLERYYNQFAAERINAVSNVLYGYDRAVTRNYAPIYTNSNYNQKEIGKYDQTAEGVGNMKQRVRGAKNPSYNISAYDAFERHVDQTARFVGMAIPARNWKTLLNWRERNDSMSDVITHKWGEETLTYITNLLTDLQGGAPRKERFEMSSFADKLWSNYISAIFGANPSIIIKQLGSIPLGGAYLGVENVPSPGQLTQIDRELISKYTSELDWRLMGYATPETKQLKDHPNWTQRNSFFRNVFGGGAITGMDGWAASTLWPWAENKVRREQPELEVGTQEQIDAGQSPFYRAVAAEFDNAVNRSQSMSDTLHNARIRKSDNAVLRTLTMFKSDAAQTYNAFRQTIGEAQYYKRVGADSDTQRKAKAAVGTSHTSWILNAALAAAVNFLVNLAKRQGANYRDDEGELTAPSVLSEMASDMVGGLSGVVVLGEELADVIGNIVTGKRWYGIDAPGIEQMNDTLEAIQNGGKKLMNLVSEAANIEHQGGSVLEYLNEHKAEIAGGIKELAATVVTYFPGLPVNNVEAYITGILSWVAPELSTAYEDAFTTPEKSSLEGLEDDALVTRVRDILSQRLNEVSELTAQTVATLYTAGYSNALPSNTPSSVSVKGEDGKIAETVEFDAFKQQFYNRVWTETVGTAVDELTAMPEFEAAGPEDQVKMLRKVYDYADGMARAEVVEGYQPSNTILNAAEEIAAGASLAEWALYDVLSADVSGNFDRAVDQGLDYESALEVAEAVEDAGEGASSAEKYLAVAELPLSELDKEAALEGIMSESAYERYSAARAAGIDTYEYCAFLADAESISGDGRQERIWALIDGMALSRAQKDALHLAAGYKDTTLSKAPWNR